MWDGKQKDCKPQQYNVVSMRMYLIANVFYLAFPKIVKLNRLLLHTDYAINYFLDTFNKIQLKSVITFPPIVPVLS